MEGTVMDSKGHERVFCVLKVFCLLTGVVATDTCEVH